MKIGIVITTFNRPEYLRECLDSLIRADIPDNVEFCIVDDASTDQQTIDLIEWFCTQLRHVSVIRKTTNSRVSDSLLRGYIHLFQNIRCDVVMNLDSDAIVRNDFIRYITSYQSKWPDHIITGFNCNTKNADGTDRHKILKTGYSDGFLYNTKASVGGINMCMNEKVFRAYVEPTLVAAKEKGNWDHMACINAMKENKPVVCVEPSVIQHIGFNSSMNHIEAPDVADDFKGLHLPGVTLVIVDCVNIERAIEAVNRSCENIQFGDVKILSSIAYNDPRVVHITHLGNITQYSNFMLKSLNKYFNTPHALVIQYDGYVLNYKAWNHEWLNLDYIGAKWWYKDGMNVGNGGFSLRSEKLYKALSEINIPKPHPEDDVICRQLRKKLEEKGIVFGTEEQADQFSIESNHTELKTYAGQFGFHGKRINFSGQKETIVINQFFGLGDILFSMQIARDYIDRGHRVIWPVEPQFANIQKHFPEIIFIDKRMLAIDYNNRTQHYIGGYKVIPLRWSQHIMNVPFRDCMKTKYTMFGQDWKRWRSLTWQRDEKSERELFVRLGIKPTDKYVVVNQFFQSDSKGRVGIEIVDKSVKVVHMRNIDNFTLLDWGAVLENAFEIHTVSTSIIYMLEMIELKARAVCIYKRWPVEKSHENYEYILTNKHKYLLK